VITSPLTAVPTMVAIMAIGARPVFAEVNPLTLTIDPEAVAASVTPRTTAVVPVHLYGHVADLPNLLKVTCRHNLTVVEDACQAHGAVLNGQRVGTFGHAGCFSFYPTKNLGAYGDGGMVVTSDASIAERLRRLRQYGQASRDNAVEPGRNSRLDELQAAILRVKLPYLEGWNARRRELASLYAQELPQEEVRMVSPLRGSIPVYHLYVIQTALRQALRKALANRGISTEVHYPIPCHLQEAAKGLGYGSGAFPNAESAVASVVSLPCYPEAPDSIVFRVCEVIHEHLFGS
jgi:dTDP-4-amino-4,6-dideoxygalactose transaminase